MSLNRSVLITGCGIVSAIGLDCGQVLDSLLKVRTGVGPLKYLRTGHTEFPVGEVKLSDEEMERMMGIAPGTPTTRTALMGMIALHEALGQSGLNKDDLKECGFVNGTTVGGMDKSEQYYLDFIENDSRNAYISTHDCGSCSEMIADRFGHFKMITTISTACSSAANAIEMAADMIRLGEADIVVAGLGTAGSMAAIRGARSGLRVMGIEQLGFPGGTNTAGAIQGYYAGVKGGLYQQIDQRASEIGDKLVSCHVAYSKSIALQEAFSQANVITKYDARVCQVLTQGQRVVGLLYRDAEGLHRVRTKMVIDATADGTVCREFHFSGSRTQIKLRAAMAAIGLAFDRAKGLLKPTAEDEKATQQSREKKARKAEREARKQKRLQAGGGEK